jgi:hypothetical protein
MGSRLIVVVVSVTSQPVARTKKATSRIAEILLRLSGHPKGPGARLAFGGSEVEQTISGNDLPEQLRNPFATPFRRAKGAAHSRSILMEVAPAIDA